MKTLLKSALVSCASLLALSGTASAQGLFNFEPTEGYFYVSGFVGVAVPSSLAGVDLDSDVNYGGAVGGRLPFKSLGFIHTRLELEVSYFETTVDFDTPPDVLPTEPFDVPSIDNLFIYGNSFADLIWRENQRAIPYIGGGLGVAISDTTGVSSATNFSTSNSIGLTVPINQIDIYGEARYFKVYNDGPNLDGFNFTAGLRWKF